ncbi:hypothetical protein ACHHV8_05505 [Paenibacillus sp. TAB 01]|uniref:hypothetical protein n=1 Tax=Paenibacillus sp. TAB 01 TaxID=3368988 RepID=UPI0037503761
MYETVWNNQKSQAAYFRKKADTAVGTTQDRPPEAGRNGPLHKTRRSNPIKGRARRTVRPVLRRKKRAPGYSRAYNAAFDQAYNEGFSAGFKQGLEDGQQAP